MPIGPILGVILLSLQSRSHKRRLQLYIYGETVPAVITSKRLEENEIDYGRHSTKIVWTFRFTLYAE